MKCDQISDDWIVFKRKQKRITELLLLILKDIIVKRIRDRFYEHREAQTRAAQIKYGVSRLVFYTNRKLFQPRGKNQFVRHRNKIRHCLSFLNLYDRDR